jgi:hypothetical protein
MKKIIIPFLGIGLACIVIHACSKKTINGDASNLVEGSYITLDSSINQNLDFSNSAATVSIKVGSKGSPVASVNIYAATGAKSLDTTTWVLIKNVPYSDGVVLSVSTAELAKALAPKTISPGTTYVLQNQVVTKDGRKFSAANTPTNFSSFPAYNVALTWNAVAVCPFNQAAAIGAYKVVSDADWQDFSPGDPITVVAGPNSNSISFLAYPSPAAGGTSRQLWIVNVAPASGAATMTSQYVGDYPGAPNATASATGYVFSCSGLITLNVKIVYGGTPYANQRLILQHQ